MSKIFAQFYPVALILDHQPARETKLIVSGSMEMKEASGWKRGLGALLGAAVGVLGGTGQAKAETFRVQVTAFRGDLSHQAFTTYSSRAGTGDAMLFTKQGQPSEISVKLEPSGAEGWHLRLHNGEPGMTVCQVTLTLADPVRLDPAWRDERLIWPALYRGAKIDDLGQAASFAAQAKRIDGVPFLTAAYQGGLCLPFFVQEGRGGMFSILVQDPTHEVVRLTAQREEAGLRYSVALYPRVDAGTDWSFGEIDVIRGPQADWHQVADRHRAWLVEQGFKPPENNSDIAVVAYLPSEFHPDDIVEWANQLGIRDVLLWDMLYGRSDQYYPCYFPDEGVTGEEKLKSGLGELRRHGLHPYFYVNGYLISPLQTPADVHDWKNRFPDRYTANDLDFTSAIRKFNHFTVHETGYAAAARAFREKGNDFGGDWLTREGGILPLRARRVDFTYGEYPILWWHGRPFYPACIASPDWRKVLSDSARLHAKLGADGIYLDQVGAMRPEISTGAATGPEEKSFGFWNRAYLELLRQVQAAGRAVSPAFFMECEGSADLDGKYISRSMGEFRPEESAPEAFPALFRYTVPWFKANLGTVNMSGNPDPAATRRLLEKTLLLGETFRIAIGSKFEEAKPQAQEMAGMVRAAIAARRNLASFYDGGDYMDDQGLQVSGGTGTWFRNGGGTLVAIQAKTDNASFSLTGCAHADAAAAWSLDWRTGLHHPASCALAAGVLKGSGLREGLTLMVIPRRKDPAGP